MSRLLSESEDIDTDWLDIDEIVFLLAGEDVKVI
jgi:hypothetical protein